MPAVADVPAVDDVSAMLVSPLFWHFLYANVLVSAGSTAFAIILVVAGDLCCCTLACYCAFSAFFDTYIDLSYKKLHFFTHISTFNTTL